MCKQKYSMWGKAEFVQFSISEDLVQLCPSAHRSSLRQRSRHVCKRLQEQFSSFLEDIQSSSLESACSVRMIPAAVQLPSGLRGGHACFCCSSVSVSCWDGVTRWIVMIIFCVHYNNDNNKISSSMAESPPCFMAADTHCWTSLNSSINIENGSFHIWIRRSIRSFLGFFADTFPLRPFVTRFSEQHVRLSCPGSGPVSGFRTLSADHV